MTEKCQSCAMPMKNETWGTNADGSSSTDYCHYCFQDGAFTQPTMSAKEMQAFCIEKMKEMGMPRFLGWLFTRNIPRLKRWSGE